MTRGDFIHDLAEEGRVAAGLRNQFLGSDALALNLIGSAGSGKTSLLERTLPRLPVDVEAAVIAGDIDSDVDARRLSAFGFPVAAIRTKSECHLTPAGVRGGLDQLGTQRYDILFIENVGSLLCPARVDLGEASKVAVLSVTDGDDAPRKYPMMFARADLLVINKIDLLPHVQFDCELTRRLARDVHPAIEIVEVSCETGEGIGDWLHWITRRLLAVRSPTAFLHGIR